MNKREFRTFYLSFADDDGFRGAAVVDVTEDDAALAKLDLAIRFPNALPGAEWIAAATRKAHAKGCNPGGEVLSCDITDAYEKSLYPRNKLMSKADLEAIAPIERVE